LRNLFLYLAAVIVIGSRQRAMMNLLHQASHQLLFKHKRLNTIVANLFLAYPLLNTLKSYRADHVLHHAHTWEDDHDPKTIIYRLRGLVAPSDKREFRKKHILFPLLLQPVPRNVLTVIWLKGASKKEATFRLAYWAALLTAIITTGTWWPFLLFWVIPFLTSFQVIRYFGEMAEHSGLQSTDPWQATRAWSSCWLVRWLVAPHNDEMHLTHHLFQRIPHYKIRRAHDLLMEAPEYAAAHHCYGLFWSRRPGVPSVVEDILETSTAKLATLDSPDAKAV
jgi:fatty acid desaturase